MSTPPLRRDLAKPDSFQASTGEGVAWVERNRGTALGMVAALVVLLLVAVGGYTVYQSRSEAARTAFGNAMQVYQTPVVTAGQELPPGMTAFHTAAERATKANAQFVAVADQYGSTQSGKLARYFAGLTYMEAGQNGPAESTLKQVASSWNGDISALGKLALAQLYQQMGRDGDATTSLSELSKGHAATVPSGLAQIQLAELYDAEGKKEQARKMYAEIQDHDKDAKGKPGIAAQLAKEKLNPTPAGPAAGGPQ